VPEQFAAGRVVTIWIALTPQSIIGAALDSSTSTIVVAAGQTRSADSVGIERIHAPPSCPVLLRPPRLVHHARSARYPETPEATTGPELMRSG
jgi:hypothetical protein